MLRSLDIILWREIRVTTLCISRLAQNYATPILTLLLFALLFSSNMKGIHLGGRFVSYFQFFLPGLFVLQTFQLFVTTFSMVRIDKATRIVSLIITTGTPTASYFCGKLLASLGLLLLQIALVTVAAMSVTKLGFQISPSGFALAVLGVTLSGLLWFSVGFVCGAFIESENVRDAAFTLIGLPVVFSSSIYYNIDIGPKVIQWVAWANPLNHACRLVRGGLFNQVPEAWLIHLCVLALFATAGCIVALKALSRLTI